MKRLALPAAIVLLLASGAFGYASLVRSQRDARWSAHTHQVLEKLNLLWWEFSGADNGLRRLVLKSDAAGIAAVRANASNVTRLQRELSELTADNAGQQERLRRLEDALRSWRERVDATIARPPVASLDVAGLDALLADGREQRAAVRALIDAMTEHERELLVDRDRGADAAFRRARALLVSGSALAISLALLGAAAYRSEERRRRSAEQALRESEAGFRLALNAARVGTWQHDLRTGERIWSDEAWQLFGYAREQGMPAAGRFYDRVHPDDREILERAIARAVAPGGADFTAEYRVATEAGEWRWLATRGRSERDPAGTPVHMQGVVLDITDRKLADAAARAAADEVRDLFDNSPCGYHSLDASGLLVRVNATELRWLGYSREELVGRWRFADLLAPASRARFAEEFPRFLETGSVKDLEFDVVRKDGSLFPVSLSATAMKDAEGRFVMTRATLFDITERRLADERVRHANRLLEAETRRAQAATRMKSEFLANMSHELRTPLNSIIGFAELMHDAKLGPVSAEHREFLGDILSSSRHLLQLINDVLDLAKVEAGKMDFRPEELELERVISEVRDVLRTQTAKQRLEVVVDVAPEVSRVRLDPAKLKQVLFNYLSNALKFTPPGGRIRVVAQPVDVQHFRLSVDDTGPGIANDDLARLFTEFEQLDSGSGKRHQGTGLGLALVKRIVEAQGGRVEVTSQLGRGSQFSAVLPRSANFSAEPPVQPRAIPANGVNARVLVVEDDPDDRDWLVRELTRAGYSAATAMTGAEAVAHCRAERFDAISLDLLLPDMSGWQVLHAAREGLLNANTPVVIVTVAAEQRGGTAFSITDFLVKPLRPEELLASLQRAGVAPYGSRPVLVVDDDAKALKLMELTLTQLGYQALCHQDSIEGLRVAEEARPGVIVLDLLMPGMNGFEFLYRLRRSELGRQIPVLVWTVQELSPDDRAALQQMAQAVISKGNGSLQPLIDEIRGHVESARRSAAGDAASPEA